MKLFPYLAFCILYFLTACGIQGRGSALNEDSSESGVVFSYDKEGRVGKATIDLSRYPQQSLSHVKDYTGGSIATSGVVPAQNLLSPYARQVALTFPTTEFVNCWFTSMASLMPGFDKPRYMGDKEFACHLNQSFKKTTTPQFGDVVRFQDKDGGEVHGATYVGVDEATGGVIVFSKNGPTKATPFGFSTIESLSKTVYRETASVTFYRPAKKISDPKSAGADCFEEAEASRFDSAQMGDRAGRPSGGILNNWDM